jgi:hypothetical protein
MNPQEYFFDCSELAVRIYRLQLQVLAKNLGVTYRIRLPFNTVKSCGAVQLSA